MRDIKFLTGAPGAESLDWSEAEAVNEFIPAIRRFLDGQYFQNGSDTLSAASSMQQSYPKWRSIELDKLGHEQEDAYEIPDSLGKIQERGTQIESTEFLEHSLAVLEGHHAVTSQNSAGNDLDMSLGESNFDSASLLTGGPISLQDNFSNIEILPSPRPDIITLPQQLIDVRRLASAEHIESIQPQTITANLLVGIISISPLRQIQLRKWGKQMEILELLVGDETSAAFSVTVWLASPEPGKPVDGLRSTMAALRPGDVICAQNIALSVFRGQVHGQSLNKRINRVETRIQVLGKDGQVVWEKLRQNNRIEHMDKVRRVESWAREFLCAPKQQRDQPDKHRKQKIQEELPPDTQ